MTVFLSLSLGKVGSIPELSCVTLSFATNTNWYGLSTLSIQSSTVTLAMRGIYTPSLTKSRFFIILLDLAYFLLKKAKIQKLICKLMKL